VVDEKGQTTREGVFAAGDVVTGAKTVVDAAYRAKYTADAIDEYVRRKLQ
jgi:glutamate synthase (NADPH/NADH) small chain